MIRYPAQWLPAILGAAGMWSLAAAAGWIGWGALAALIWVAVFYLWKRMVMDKPQGQSQPAVHSQSLIDKKTESFLHTVSLHRHDLMNEIQLLSGYVQLQKYDRLRDFVEQMKNKAAQESVLFRLGAPQLVLYLYQLQADNRQLKVELEIEEDLKLDQCVTDADTLGAGIMELIQLFEAYGVSKEEVNSLVLEMFKEEGELHIYITFEGEYEVRSLRERYEKMKHRVRSGLQAVVMAWEQETHGVSIRLQIPLAEN